MRGDAALAAKALATFRREHEVLAFKGGTMDGEVVTIEQIEAISPACPRATCSTASWWACSPRRSPAWCAG